MNGTFHGRVSMRGTRFGRGVLFGGNGSSAPPAGNKPTDISLSASSILETALPGAAIATISADGDGPRSFSKVQDPDGKFRIEGSNLVLDQAIDFETDTQHTVELRAANAAGFFDEEFIISVIDVAESIAPTDIILSATDVDENAGLGSVVATIAADGSPASTFSIVSDPDNKFEISGSNLILDGALDYEAKTSHNVTIRASNSEGSHDELFTIQVNDILEATAPAAMVDADWSVDTGTGNQTVAFTITNEPDDGGASITDYQYDINGNDTWVSLGLSAPGTVERTMAEADTSYDFRVRAVNSVDPAPASNTESATSSAAASGVTSVGDDDVTFNFEAARTAGSADDPNIHYVVGQTVITSVTPAVTTFDGGDVNGAQLNLEYEDRRRNLDGRYNQEGGSGKQAFLYDDDYPDVGDPQKYGGQPDFPLTLNPGDILIKSKGNLEVMNTTGNMRWGLFENCVALVCVDNAPPANSLGPAVIQWPGRGTPRWDSHNLSTVLANLDKYTINSAVPNVQDVLDAMDCLNFAYGFTDDAGLSYPNFEMYMPSRVTGATSSNYGREFNRLVHVVLCLLMSTNITEEQRNTLGMRAMQWGKQWLDPRKGLNIKFREDGGHFNAGLSFKALYLVATGKTVELATLLADHGGNFNQVFRITADQAAQMQTWHTDNGTKSAQTRIRQVVSSSGTTLVVNGIPSALIDPFRIKMEPVGRVTRRNDGASAIVLDTTDDQISSSDSNLTLTLDAEPSPPFAASDDVYFQSAYPVVEGNVTWCVSGADNIYAWIESASTQYRDANRYGAHVLFLHNLLNSSGNATALAQFDALTEYTRKAQANYPLEDNWSGMHLAWNFLDTAENFWSDHAGSILPPYDMTVAAASNIQITNVTETGFQLDFDMSVSGGKAWILVEAGTAARDNGEVSRMVAVENITGTSHSKNVTGLTAGTQYTVHILPASANNFWPATPQTVTQTTAASGGGDTTAPILSLPTGLADGATGARNLGVSTDEGNGVLRWGIYPAAATPSDDDVVAGTGATVSNNQGVSSAGVQSIPNQTGLSASTAYKVHFVHEDAASPPNRSNLVTSATFTTAASGGLPVTSGRVLHLESDLGVTLKDTDTHLNTWADQSPEGNTPTVVGDWDYSASGTPSGAPSFDTGGFSGGAHLELAAPSGFPTGSAARTMFLVVQYDSANSSYTGFHYGNNASNEAWGIVIGNTGKVLIDGWGGSNSVDTGVNIVGQGWTVLCAVLAVNGDYTIYQDGSVIASGNKTWNTADPAANDGFVINKGLSNNSKANMHIAAAGLYSRALSPAEVASINSYLTAKYVTV
ncbi:hypothetical protein IWQ49_000009 [Labrenzia sp. EL_126]|nr:hypothetical protein [Labrenzia sp. EL_126]